MYVNSVQTKTPIVFIIFNRPELTQQVFDQIASVRPSQLFVIADGPRLSEPGEKNKCQLARSILNQVDWPCEVYKNYSETNLGCNLRISSGLDWVFNQVESAIILEDDCLPNITFFRFCDELLHRYRDDERIMTISGDNFQFGIKRTSHSYYYSRFNHCWGWATWRRAWKHYDIAMSQWPEVSDGKWLHDLFRDPWAARYWKNKFQGVYDNKIDTWDFRWTFACWIHSGLSILPNVNLVSNIGFSSDASRTRYHRHPLANLATFPMKFPLQHPSFMIRDERADRRTQSHQFGILSRSQRKLRELLGV